jgi:hypothetical protein
MYTKLLKIKLYKSFDKYKMAFAKEDLVQMDIILT